MKTLTISLTMTALLAIAAPPTAWCVGLGGGAGGSVGGLGGGAGGHVGGSGGEAVGQLDAVGRVGPGSPGAPLDHAGHIDRDDRFEQGGMLGFRAHLDGRVYPACFAYPYCPASVVPCAWQGAGQASVDEDSAETAYGDWVPPGCD